MHICKHNSAPTLTPTKLAALLPALEASRAAQSAAMASRPEETKGQARGPGALATTSATQASKSATSNKSCCS